MWLDRIPASVAFCDVETTGLAKDDRIVSFGGIGMISSELAAGQLDLRYSYLVFNPGKKNHRHAEQVHGFSDLSLRFQDPFKVHAAQVRRFLASNQLLVAHNAAFDFRIRQSRVDIGTPAHAHPADLLHHERIPGTRHRRQRFSERRLQSNQACSFRRDAWGDGGCLAFDADPSLAARLPTSR